MRASIFLLVASACSSLAAANLCPTFQAKNSTASTYHIQFFNNGQYENAPATLPANLTASNPIKLATAAFPDNKFTITNCTSTTQSSCTHGGCYINYETTGQITHGEKCMTQSAPNSAGTSTYSLLPCTGPSDTTQLFALSQYVNYAPAYASVYSYAKVTVDLLQPGLDGDETGQLYAWFLGTNNRTLERIEYMYTQAGLSAYLI